MNRRTAVRNIVILSAGASLLPGCTSSDEGSIPLRHIPLSASQEKLMAELTSTIIPKTNDFIGATDLHSDRFVLLMIDDCASPDDQKSFTASMKDFDNSCRKKFSTGFVKCSPHQRVEFLKELEASKDEKDAAVKFYKSVKRYTIQSFTTSKEYLLDLMKWKIVPGSNFKGCIPV
jgi:hypothetical protein